MKCVLLNPTSTVMRVVFITSGSCGVFLMLPRTHFIMLCIQSTPPRTAIKIDQKNQSLVEERSDVCYFLMSATFTDIE